MSYDHTEMVMCLCNTCNGHDLLDCEKMRCKCCGVDEVAPDWILPSGKILPPRLRASGKRERFEKDWLDNDRKLSSIAKEWGVEAATLRHWARDIMGLPRRASYGVEKE